MTTKPLILLVDDNQEILDFVSDDLSEKYDVFKAVNGQEAMKILDQESIHLVISDIMMPVMDGYELCRAIKSNVEYSHIPIILLTAKNTLKSRIQGLEEGADAYIEKPFSPEHLQVQVANLLTNRHKIKEHFATSPLVNINTIAYSKADEHFLQQVNDIIHRHIEDIDLGVEQLAEFVNMSRATLYRKIKSISNLTPVELINITRLKKAAELLSTDSYKIYEIAEMVGFGSQTHFGRSFHKQFGVSPSDYLAVCRENVRKETRNSLS
jgi:DNA-binding response OmpR family regulator